MVSVEGIIAKEIRTGGRWPSPFVRTCSLTILPRCTISWFFCEGDDAAYLGLDLCPFRNSVKTAKLLLNCNSTMNLLVEPSWAVSGPKFFSSLEAAVNCAMQSRMILVCVERITSDGWWTICALYFYTWLEIAIIYSGADCMGKRILLFHERERVFLVFLHQDMWRQSNW